MSDFIEWGALGQVLVAGVLVGAGIPALFALGLRLLAGTTPDDGAAPAAEQTSQDATGRTAGSGPIVRPTPARFAGGVLCMAVVIAAIATGLVFVISGGH
ncbi:hypothetical protein C8K30_102194 [Promicromonospora sp. AC04]|uniref:hypothetical protein n=1 Tax=Promicromonospora sp. AC04 TaxID=2135723 RepID=UPI000D358C27|nr:hypothetical protein [Promicromonospora sp. AC04]PUB29819.1 hypothetical protein C8K30_102194 [Promicromonospora sp. AC04]